MRITGPSISPIVPPAAARPAPVRAEGTAGRIVRADPAPSDSPPAGARALRLVAAVVPGSIDFAGVEPAPARPATPIYRRPADANAAATGVALGSRLDVTG
ncbi:MAG: hypothetical protein D6693_08725 [Planctomycetota bacterium]|nr:MAG: hypothetical protein D6693_08725 [Planctomycetota bacterium]